MSQFCAQTSLQLTNTDVYMSIQLKMMPNSQQKLKVFVTGNV